MMSPNINKTDEAHDLDWLRFLLTLHGHTLTYHTDVTSSETTCAQLILGVVEGSVGVVFLADPDVSDLQTGVTHLKFII
jgi:hypothetical protein